MACPGDARADGPPSPHRGAPFRGSWLSTWAGDDTRPAGQQTVLKSGWCEGILIMGLTSVIPSWSSGAYLPTASLTLQVPQPHLRFAMKWRPSSGVNSVQSFPAGREYE